MDVEIRRDSLGWDVVNWGRGLNYLDRMLPEDLTGYQCLELGCGGHNGGLSLWLAHKGAQVICSNVGAITDTTRELHHKHGCAEHIFYEQLDATDLPYQNKFDLIVFKSMLGGIVRDRPLDVAERVIVQIQGALKPGGSLLFMENMGGTALHRIMRRCFVRWGNSWRYLTLEELLGLCGMSDNYHYRTFGSLGCFGPNERLRRWLGHVDGLLDPLLPEAGHYIFCAGVERPR